MVYIYLISGKARAGKDTFANFFEAYVKSLSLGSCYTLHYATRLKDVATLLGWDGKKDQRGRTLLQKLGTEVGREYQSDIWVRHLYNDLIQRVKEKEDTYIFVPDFRFPNEESDLYDMCFSNQWKLDTHLNKFPCINTVRIINKDIEIKDLDATQQQHPSEIALDDFDFDIIIKRADVDFKIYIDAIQTICNGPCHVALSERPVIFES